LAHSIGGRVVRAVAATLPAWIEEHETVDVAQGLCVADVGAAPIVETAEEADVEDEGWTAAIDLIVEPDTAVGGKGHRGLPAEATLDGKCHAGDHLKRVGVYVGPELTDQHRLGIADRA
jgi:hypothetical protein